MSYTEIDLSLILINHDWVLAISPSDDVLLGSEDWFSHNTQFRSKPCKARNTYRSTAL